MRDDSFMENEAAAAGFSFNRGSKPVVIAASSKKQTSSSAESASQQLTDSASSVQLFTQNKQDSDDDLDPTDMNDDENHEIESSEAGNK